jgi:hypothetical protein
MTNEFSPWIIVALTFGILTLLWSVLIARAWGGKHRKK